MESCPVLSDRIFGCRRHSRLRVKLPRDSQRGRDDHSIEADALFLDPAHGDYRVRDGGSCGHTEENLEFTRCVRARGVADDPRSEGDHNLGTVLR